MTSSPRTAERRDVVTDFRRRLAAQVRGADPGSGTRCFVVRADSGVGKTSMLRDAVGALDAAGGLEVTIGWATAAELSWRAPYSVIGDALGRPVPDILGTGADGHFLAAVDDWAAAGPCLLVIDDAHHADAAS